MIRRAFPSAFLTVLTLAALILLPLHSARAVPGDLVWDQLLGGVDSDAFGGMIQLPSGDLLAGGWSASDTDFNSEFYAARVTVDGALVWEQTYPDTEEQSCFAVAATDDGGALLVGGSNVFSGPTYDVIAKRIDGNGALVWEQSYDVNVLDFASAVTAGPDGGFAIAGYTYVSDHDEALLLVIDGDGNELWHQTYRLTQQDWRALDILYRPGAGYTLAGFSEDAAGDRTPQLIEVNLNGAFQSLTSLDGLGFGAEAWSVIRSRDSQTYYVAGHADPTGSGSLRGLLWRHDLGDGTNVHQLFGDNSTHFDHVTLAGDELVLTGNRMGAGWDFSAYTLAVDPADFASIHWENDFSPAQGYANGTAVLPLFPHDVAVCGQAVDGNYEPFVLRVENEPAAPWLDARPESEAIVIPAAGGSFTWSLQLTNPGDAPFSTVVRTGVTTPSGALVPLQQQATVLPAEWQSTLEGLQQQVPAGAPAGSYTFHAALFQQGEMLDHDSFTFSKQGAAAQPLAGSDDGWDHTTLALPEGAPVAAGPSDDPAVAAGDAAQPGDFVLHPIVPNPFNGQATVTVDMPVAGSLRLALYNTIGQEVLTLADGGTHPAGRLQFSFLADHLASGVYFVRAEAAGRHTAVQKVTLAR